ASFSVSAWVVSAMTTPSAVTRIRFGLAVMAMGWSGPGSFMVFSSIEPAAVIHPRQSGRFFNDPAPNIVAQWVTFKAPGARFACHGQVSRLRFERREATLEEKRRPTRMPMDARDIESMIKAAIPDAEVTIRDLAGDGDHYAATVISESFRGKSRVQQHQIVYQSLRGQMGGVLHALALQTGVPEG